MGAFNDFKVFNKVDREYCELQNVGASSNFAGTSDPAFSSELLNLFEM